MALATTTDVTAALGRPLTSDETPRATALLLLASSEVESFTGYRFAAGSYTVGRRARGGKVRLPGKVATVAAVRAVDQVTGAATVLTGYTVRGRTVFGLGRATWSERDPFVEVDFTTTAAVPDEVKGVVAGVVAATMGGTPVTAADKYGDPAGAGGPPHTLSYVQPSGKVWLNAADRLILGKYRQTRPAIDLVGS